MITLDTMGEYEPQVISEFRGRYKYLSNFYIEPDGTHVEGEYQSRKTIPPTLDLMYMSPRDAKRQGKRIRPRQDWDHIKLRVMYELVLKKFHDHPLLKIQLLGTGTAYLEESNTWGDQYWGTVNGIGHNYLGRILIKIRGEGHGP